MADNSLKKRILEISYKNKLSHLGSYFSSVDIVDNIYSQMKEDDIFILSCGHASLALYVCNEKYFGINAEDIFNKHGGHPHHNEEDKIHCSTGSLGLGITIGVGRAIANKERIVHVLISDGECAEGSVWESLKTIKEQSISNIVIHVNINGYAAYMEVDQQYLVERLKAFLPEIKIYYTDVECLPFLKGLNAHYHVMSENNYKEALLLL